MNNGKMIFVTGSAMSGKSRFAVSQFSNLDRVQYLCTGRDMDDKTLTALSITSGAKISDGILSAISASIKHPSITRNTDALFLTILPTGFTEKQWKNLRRVSVFPSVK